MGSAGNIGSAGGLRHQEAVGYRAHRDRTTIDFHRRGSVLDKVDYRPIAMAKVYVEEKYLDCVDKNYVIVALHQRLLRHDCTLVGKAEEADVVMEVTSGGVGTDRTDLFVGVTEIPLPPPSPISIPRMSIYNRTRSIGTAKIGLVAYDAKTKRPVINTDPLARSDHKAWTILGTGGTEGGSLTQELTAATGEHESLLDVPAEIAFRKPTTQR